MDKQTSNQSYEDVQAFWDQNVFNWKIASAEVGSDAFFRETERYRFEKLNYLPRIVDYDGYQGKKVLDVGCGLGNDASRFAAGGADVTCIDIAPKAIELSKQNFLHRGLNAEFEIMNGEAMTFEDNRFDLVYCHTVIHFTPNPEKLIREINRVLKPGGTAIMMTINRSSWLYFLHRLVKLKIDYMDAPVFHKFNYGEFETLMAPFDEVDFIVERFPVRTEVHKGLKALIYNKLFVDLYNALPNALIGKTGYHLLAFAKKTK